MLGLVQKQNGSEKFPFIGTNRRIVLAVRWPVKYFICSEFPDIPEKLWRRKKWRTPTSTKRFAIQANVISWTATTSLQSHLRC